MEDGIMKERSELEILQMLGRAGRPQFEPSAVAVIMTQKESEGRWERLVSGEERIESWYVYRCSACLILTLSTVFISISLSIW
jgi:replicative superfamily II helicase